MCPGSGFASTQYPTSASDIPQSSSPAGDFSVQATYKLHKVFPMMYLSGGSDQLDNCPCAGVLVTNDIQNSDPIFVGGIGDDSAYINRNYTGDNHGHILYPGQSWVDPVSNSNLVTIAGTKNEIVYISAFLNQPTDVQLDTTSPPQPNPPKLMSSNPSNGSTLVANNNLSITATFSVALDPSTVNTQNITLSPSIPGWNVTLDGTDPTKLDFSGIVGSMAPNTLYTISFGARGLASADLGFTTTLLQSFSFRTDLAPVLESTTPTANATGVGNISQFTVNLSQPLMISTITTGNITITPSVAGYAVQRDPTDVTQILAVTTALSLTANTVYTITLNTNVSSVAGYTIASPISFSFTTDAAPTTFTPVFPASGATGISTNTVINAVADKNIDPTTLNGTNITVTGGTTGTLTFNIDQTNPKQININHASNLANTTVYTVTMKVGLKSTLGFALTTQFSWSFTTASAVVNVAPTVQAVFPLNNSTGNIPLAATIQIQLVFSEAMDSTTTTNTSPADITLKQTVAGTNVPCTNTLGGDTITLTMVPTADLLPSISYTITATTGVKSAAGVGAMNMVSQFTSVFTTEARPAVLTVSPANAATGVDLLVHPVITFTTAMKTSTLTTSNIFLTGVTSTIALTTDSNGRSIATLTPTSPTPLANNTTYTVNATTGCQASDTYPMASNFTSTFTTNNFAPTVTATNPTSAATAVAVTIHPTITFSKAMKSATIITTNIFLNPGPVAASVSYDSTNHIATITPNASLANNTTYTITATTSVQENQYSIPLASQFTSTFTTVGAAPTIVSTNPANGAITVAISVIPTITFSIPMNPTTITTSSCYITDPNSNVIPATVTLDGTNTIASVDPTNNLLYSTAYTLNVTTGCKSAGNVALSGGQGFGFTTKALSFTQQYVVSVGGTGLGTYSTSYYLGSQNGYYAFGEQADSTKSGQKLVGFIITKVHGLMINNHSDTLGGSINIEIRDSSGNLKHAYPSSSAISLTSPIQYTGSNTPATIPDIIDTTNTYVMASGDVLLARWVSPNSTNLEIGKASSSVYGKAMFAKYASSGTGAWTSYTTKTSDDLAVTAYSTP
jgi:Bacterial Ig-like domain